MSGKFIQDFSEVEFLGHDSCCMRWIDSWKTSPYLDEFSKNRSVSLMEIRLMSFSTKYSIFDEFSRNRSKPIRADSYYMSHMMSQVI